MTLLPGQVNVGGVSNFIFGSNMSQDYAAQNTRNNTTIQGRIKNGGFTVMRCAIPAGSTNAYIDQTYNACVNMGCAMMVILIHDNATWNSSLVTYLGSRCNLYEFANEPDLYSGATDASGHANNSGAAYYYWWALNVPTLRGINASAAFIGPALGVFSNLSSFVTPWLTSCHSAGGSMMPDGISYHIYPCTGTQSQSTCAPKSGNFSSCLTTVDSLVSGIVGHSLPYCLTEWNIDANFDAVGNPYDADPTFINTWTHAALDNMVSAGYAMACQWDAGGGAGSASLKADLVNTTSPYAVTAQWQPMVDKIKQYLFPTQLTGDNPYMVKIGGTSASTGAFSGTYPSQQITDLLSLGVGWVFFQIQWAKIDATGLNTQVAANYTWGAYDQAVSQCNQAGINIVLGCFTPPPQFIVSGTTLCATPANMATFAAQVATRYNGGAKGSVQGVYIGNEDYDGGAWPTQPDFLVSVLKSTYPAVKAANSKVLVIAGAKIQRNSTYYTDWFDILLNPSTGAYISSVFQADVITFHYHTAAPTDQSGISLSLDPRVDVGAIPSYQTCWQLIDAKRKQYSNNVPVWSDECGMNVDTYPTGPTRSPSSVISPALRWTYTNWMVDSARQSGVVQKYGLFTVAEYAGYAGPAPFFRDGQSIVQGLSNAPVYDDTFVGLQAYIDQYPSWGGPVQGVLNLANKARHHFITQKSKLSARSASKFTTKQHLISKAWNHFVISTGSFRQLRTIVRNFFSVQFSPHDPEYARDQFAAIDGKDTFVGRDGNDNFHGIG